jgi:hypothetical protein
LGGASSTTAQFQTAVSQFQTAVAEFSAKGGAGGIGIPGISGLGGGGGADTGGGGDIGDLTDSGMGGLPDIPGFASGGDFDMTPGGSMVVGEAGPELLRFSASASGDVVPNSSLGGNTHNHYYDLRGADPAAVQKLYQMLPVIENRAVERARAEVSETTKRSLRR